MFDLFRQLFDSSGIPHGYCIAWEPQLLWTMVAGNALVALAYFSIPVALYRFTRLQPDLPFRSMFWLFCTFIFFCGLTHIIDIVNIWRPVYRLDGAMMALTAGVSVATASALFPLVPRASAYLDGVRAQGEELLRLNAVLQQTGEELHLRNHALENSEKRFRQTLEHAPIGLALVGLDGQFLDVNQSLSSMFGYPTEVLRQKKFQDITHPDDLAADTLRAKRLIAGEETSIRWIKRYITASGEVITAQIDSTLLQDASGTPLYFISQIQDVTERQRVEAALRKSEALAQSLSRLEEVLQICRSREELGPPVAEACLSLFPGSSGALYLRNASRNWMELLHQWGGSAVSEPVFTPQECWGLRDGKKTWAWFGQPHRHRCSHLGTADGAGTLDVCLPMLAQGDVIGLLYLSVPRHSPAGDLKACEEDIAAAERVAGRLGVAAANLDLLETLRVQSVRDPLTGLYNRRHLMESLSRDLARAQRDGIGLAVMMIDIDHFKRFNDEHGHAVGDIALVRVAQVLSAFCRRGDLAARYGGEEFTVVMTTTDQASAVRRAQALCQIVDRITVDVPGGAELSVTISLGLAMFPGDAQQAPELINAADQALYRAKRAGRNCVVWIGAEAEAEIMSAELPAAPEPGAA